MTDHTHPPADYSFSDRHQENLRMSKTAPKWNVVKDALSPTHPPTPDMRDAVIAQLQSDLSHMERQWSASQDLLAQSKELEFAFDEVATFRVVIAQLVGALRKIGIAAIAAAKA